MTDTVGSRPAPPPPGGTARLGDRTVARIGFGAMQLPGPGVLGPPRDHAEAIGVLRRAVELGVDHVDTAGFYGPDVANPLIREALHPYPEGLVVVSKVGAQRDAAGGWLPAQRPDELREAVEDDLRSLALDQVPVMNLRLMDPEHLAHAPADQRVALDDQIAAMTALRDEGKIGDFGLSNVSLQQLEQALPAGPVCVQNPYSVLDRSGEPLLRACAAAGVAWVPFFPLGSAFPGMPKVTENPAVQDAARRLGATAAQVGLAWLLVHAPNVLLIPGTSRRAHLEENVAVGAVRLDDAAVTALDALATPGP